VPVFKALVDKTKLDPSEIGDIVVGTVLAPGSQRAIECRMAALYAGFPGNFHCFSYNLPFIVIPVLINYYFYVM
jgi:acetyl-CoA acetyltransferase